jgi:hypothetical protein
MYQGQDIAPRAAEDGIEFAFVPVGAELVIASQLHFKDLDFIALDSQLISFGEEGWVGIDQAIGRQTHRLREELSPREILSKRL